MVIRNTAPESTARGGLPLRVQPRRRRIRQYGFLANRVRHEKLPLCQALLRGDKEDATLGDGVAVDEAGTIGVAPSEAAAADESCPACHKGRMIVVGIIEPASLCRRDHPAPQPVDTS